MFSTGALAPGPALDRPTWSLLSTQLGAVPRRLIWDNETGIGERNRLAAGVGEFLWRSGHADPSAQGRCHPA